MTITTEFEIDQTVYSSHNDHPTEGIVKRIYINVSPTGKTEITYNLGDGPHSPATYGVEESKLYASKEEFLTGRKGKS